MREEIKNLGRYELKAQQYYKGVGIGVLLSLHQEVKESWRDENMWKTIFEDFDYGAFQDSSRLSLPVNITLALNEMALNLLPKTKK